MLDEAGNHPEKTSEIEKKIWEQSGVDRAILVTDLTGFTRLTRENGILHFLTCYRRAVHIAEPIILSHHCHFRKKEADNVIASFPSVSNAVNAAREIINTPLNEVKFCMGIGWGRIIELEDDIYGDAVNLAFKLGEDVANGGEILLSEDAAKHCDLAMEGPLHTDCGHIDLIYYKLKRL